MKKIYLIFLSLILGIYFLTRLFQITTNPPSLYWDEASIGYNAYSILTTGQDEWGTRFPIHFRAFGEFKLPVFIYTVAIFEFFLGLTELAVRLPAVIYGCGVIILTYLIGKKLFSEKVGILSSLILTVMPWYFLISRVGYEANAGLMFFLLGLYLWLVYDKKTWLLLISVISFVLSMYSYNSFRVVVPLTSLYLLIFQKNWKNITKKTAEIWIFCGLILIGSLAQIVKFTLSTSGTNRLGTIGIFNGDWTEILNNFAKNYLLHFSLDFLFIKGDINLRSHIGYGGELSWVFLPFLILGIWYLIKKRQFLPLYLILISIIPAALTRESPHALRTISLVPFLAIMIGSGIVYLGQHLRKWEKYYYLIICVVIFIPFCFYLKSFTVEYPSKSAKEWQYSYKQIFSKGSAKFNDYDHVIISDAGAQPYIIGLFYLKYDPNQFRKTVSYNPPNKWGFSTVEKFDKYIFLNPSKVVLPKGKNLIYEYE